MHMPAQDVKVLNNKYLARDLTFDFFPEQATALAALYEEPT